MTEDEALAAAHALIETTWPAGVPEGTDPRKAVRALVEARQVALDLCDAEIAGTLEKVAKAQAALADAERAAAAAPVVKTERAAEVERVTFIRDTYLASLPPEPTNVVVGAHTPTISITEN